MDKMNANFFRYTLVLLLIAVIFIVIGSISLSRTIDDPENRFMANFDRSIFQQDFARENTNLKEKLNDIKIVVENSNMDKETKNKINDILERK